MGEPDPGRIVSRLFEGSANVHDLREMGFRVIDATPPPKPRGECLGCGHLMEFAVYVDRPLNRNVGLCAACRDLAEANRGGCSPERGCQCEPLP